MASPDVQQLLKRGSGQKLITMKLITMALMCLLLAAVWLRDAESKSCEWWHPRAWAQGGEMYRQVLWAQNRAHLDGTDSISAPTWRVGMEGMNGLVGHWAQRKIMSQGHSSAALWGAQT